MSRRVGLDTSAEPCCVWASETGQVEGSRATPQLFFASIIGWIVQVPSPSCSIIGRYQPASDHEQLREFILLDLPEGIYNAAAGPVSAHVSVEEKLIISLSLTRVSPVHLQTRLSDRPPPAARPHTPPLGPFSLFLVRLHLVSPRAISSSRLPLVSLKVRRFILHRRWK